MKMKQAMVLVVEESTGGETERMREKCQEHIVAIKVEVQKWSNRNRDAR